MKIMKITSTKAMVTLAAVLALTAGTSIAEPGPDDYSPVVIDPDGGNMKVADRGTGDTTETEIEKARVYEKGVLDKIVTTENDNDKVSEDGKLGEVDRMLQPESGKE